MPRSTRSAVLACALLVALTGCGAGPVDTVFSGRFSADSPIRLLNHTLTTGRYQVAYSLQVLFTPERNAVTLTCTVVDTSGSISLLEGMSQTIIEGGWTRVAASGEFELPDLTLGIRCAPGSPELMTVVIRDVTLTAKKIG